jgi:hypothetical protein
MNIIKDSKSNPPLENLKFTQKPKLNKTSKDFMNSSQSSIFSFASTK